MKKSICALAASIALGGVGTVLAQQHSDHHPAPATASAPAGAMSEGEVRKIDKDAGKVTIKHGAIENLGMPPMTMVFRPKDPRMLDKLRVGDSIRFKAERLEGVYTVTEYQSVK